MNKNMGSADRWVRALLGVLGIAAGIVLKSWWGVIGVLLLATAATGWCPGYLPFGITTLGKPKAKAP